MFYGIFNWFVKRLPYSLAVMIFSFILSALMIVFVAWFILIGTDIESEGTAGVVISALFLAGFVSFILCIIEYGYGISFGLEGKRKGFKVLNDNIIEGRIRQDISDQALLEVYDALKKINRWILSRHMLYANSIATAGALAELLTSGNLMNAVIIWAIGLIWGNIAVITGIAYDLFTLPARRECKLLLNSRGIPFKDDAYFLGLRIKSDLFIILTAFGLGVILLIFRPITWELVVSAAIILLTVVLLTKLVFETIYAALLEIKDLASDLEHGRKVSFFTGSLDREIVDLSKSLNVAADEIYFTKKALEEEKTSLELKVEDRTKELKGLNESLEEKVKERTKELEGKIGELEEYTSVTSHDLQQPLAAIQAYTQLTQKNAKMIESQANFMRELLEDLLSYSRIKEKAPSEEVKLQDILKEVKEHLKVQIQEKNAEITLKDIPETITGQPKRIEQLFLNLISNALKYTDGKTTIEVGCEGGEREYEFWVKDNGIGIEQKYFEKIFKPFWKLGKEPGTGMGLAICKAVVENHGGKIWIESTPGKGSTFKFTIPKKNVP
ncbi:MAG: HAMP domain-containing histidine kinase [Candidatus Altiarchaeota archaeon]|nr:HAMP domain-containing histidine kinase [Candidatus Altiarchaeota archaeon]